MSEDLILDIAGSGQDAIAGSHNDSRTFRCYERWGILFKL
jgi:hypothetical protein